MPWKNGYYYQNKRVGRRVISDYYGAGDTAKLIARIDQLDQERRRQAQMEARAAREAFRTYVQPPEALTTYSAAVRGVVADVLHQLGFHQHRRQWRYQRMNQIEVAEIGSAHRASAIFFKKKPTPEDLKAFRQLLNEHTPLARSFGDVAYAAEKLLLLVFKDHEAMRIGADTRTEQLRAGLGYDDATELERLLIDEVVLCWLDHYRITLSYAQHTKESFGLSSLEQWERVLSSKQTRYLRAIESLARVRRLLRLPAVQINVNQAGGQQVNIAGDVQV